MQHPATFNSPPPKKKELPSAFGSINASPTPFGLPENNKFVFDQCGSPVRKVA